MKAPPPLNSALQCLTIAACVLGAVVSTARADAVTDWNTAFENTLLVPAERGATVPFRTLAIMHAAVFDAVNGIERTYEPLFVIDDAPRGARAEAAAIQAAYTVLSALRPGSQTAWEAQLVASLATVPGNSGDAESIARGREWGATVANAIMAWRANDGTTTPPPPFVGSTDAGFWRHAPLGTAPAGGHQYTVLSPFLLADPTAFDPGAPYGFANRSDALASEAYAADLNETKARGSVKSTIRTTEELDEALFLDAVDLISLNGALRTKLHRHCRLVDNARAFALLNMAWFDSVIVACDIKYRYAMWRPFQAIRFADQDNNLATVPDPAWTPYLPTPSHPEYVSVKIATKTTLLRVIAELAGDCGLVQLTAYPTTAHPGGTRTFEGLAAVSDGCIESGVNLGHQFRETAEVSQVLGRAIGDEIVDHLLPRRRHGYRCSGR